ncbi:MAG: hypothetical protein QNJ55_23160 [Xenococcus sp. MO_188.B8]|nr:hypothetical protein [Xenococcus sp. MO_188.B8]
MDAKKEALAKTIAILTSVTPETTLGKFLDFCLEAQVLKSVSGKTPLAMAMEFIEDPTKIAYWAQEIMGADGEFKTEQWQALGNMDIKDPDKFLAELWEELEAIEV